MSRHPKYLAARAGLGATLGCALACLLASCGLAESVAEGFVDDQDYELYAGGGTIGTLIREVDGTDVSLDQGVVRPGDRATNHQALALLGFAFDRSLQPDKTELQWIHLRFWVEADEGSVAGMGPLIVSHLPNADNLLQGTGQVPHPPGNDVTTVADVTSSGWREVDVSQAFLADWHGGRSLSAFVVRFATATDDDGEHDYVDLDPSGGSESRRAHLVLHFGVNL